ncbi:Colicin-A immunity protein [Mixta intestinalis]|uniref:Colicin-A immunity protein n=1 Tax=Mixta intestinalis TaxID=1615494 RepID=A0A6P1PVH7_9GAMM|nr:Colicin-A immunity protein [Mixta intestinalis]
MARKNNRLANRLLFTFAFFGSFPLLAIFITYLINPESSVLYYIFTNTQDIPSVTSAFNPVMTKAMDLYCKSAPFFCIFNFFNYI